MMDHVSELLSREVKEGTTNEPLDRSNIPLHMAIAAFTGIAWYNVFELNLSVYMIFKRKRGLYFWSVFLSIQGVLLHSLAFILKLYGVVTTYQVTVSLITVGWYCMVTGQSVVLYSRLHLLVSENRVVQAVLYMIIWNAITLHVPTTVLTYGSNSPDHALFNRGYNIMENVQMTIFCVQELIISGIYIWATLRFLRPFYKRHIRSVMIQLFWINVAIIIMDIAMLSVQYMGYYSMEVAMKSAIYSVKLKIEFAVLNQLMRIAKISRDARLTGANRNLHTSKPDSMEKLTGFRGFLRRVLPKAEHDHNQGVSDCDYIGGPGVMTGSTRQRAQATGNRSVVSAVRRDQKDPHLSEEQVPGISVTREVMQVSKPAEMEVRHQGKPTSYYPGMGNGSRGASLDDDGMISDGEDQSSQLELVDLPSSTNTSGRSLGSLRKTAAGVGNGTSATMYEVDFDPMAVPRRTAQPAWKSRPGVGTLSRNNSQEDKGR